MELAERHPGAMPADERERALAIEQAAYAAAVTGDTGAAFRLLSVYDPTRFGSQPARVELTGKGGGPVETRSTAATFTLSRETIARLAAYGCGARVTLGPDGGAVIVPVSPLRHPGAGGAEANLQEIVGPEVGGVRFSLLAPPNALLRDPTRDPAAPASHGEASLHEDEQ